MSHSCQWVCVLSVCVAATHSSHSTCSSSAWLWIANISSTSHHQHDTHTATCAPTSHSYNLCANELFGFRRCWAGVSVVWRWVLNDFNEFHNARAHIATNQSVNHLPLSRIMIMAWLFKCLMLIRLLHEQTRREQQRSGRRWNLFTASQSHSMLSKSTTLAALFCRSFVSLFNSRDLPF